MINNTGPVALIEAKLPLLNPVMNDRFPLLMS